MERTKVKKMKISLVLATIGRDLELRRLFDSLCQQSEGEFEVIVVDQSEGDARKEVEVLIAYYSKFISIKYIHSDLKGLSRARNLGLKRAVGDVIGFPDDDCWYPQIFLSNVLSVFDNNKLSAYVCGQYTEPGVINNNFPQEKKYLKSFCDARVGSSVTLFINRQRIKNLSIGFDERLGAGAPYPAGEETDLMSRMIIGGNFGVYDPGVCAFHKILRGESAAHVLLSRDKAYGFWMGKHFYHAAAVNLFLMGLIKLLVITKFGREGRLRVAARVGGFFQALKK